MQHNHKVSIESCLTALAESMLSPEERLELVVSDLLEMLDAAGYDVQVESIDELIEDTERLLASGPLNEALFDALKKTVTQVKSIYQAGKKALGATLNTQAHQNRMARHDVKRAAYHAYKADQAERGMDTENDPKKLQALAQKMKDSKELQKYWQSPKKGTKSKDLARPHLGSREIFKGQVNPVAIQTGAD